MVFRGVYDNINGVRCPYIIILVRSRDGAWILLPFLIDSGADAIFLDTSCLQQMGIDLGTASEQTASGVGGKAAHIKFATALRFESEEGTRTFTGTIGVFTDPEACDRAQPDSRDERHGRLPHVAPRTHVLQARVGTDSPISRRA